jgi:hypothetical protein
MNCLWQKSTLNHLFTSHLCRRETLSMTRQEATWKANVCTWPGHMKQGTYGAGSDQTCGVLTTCRGQASLSSAACHTSHCKTYGLETTHLAVRLRIWMLLPVGRQVTVTRCYKQVLSCGTSLTESWFWTCGSCRARYISLVSRSENWWAKVWVGSYCRLVLNVVTTYWDWNEVVNLKISKFSYLFSFIEWRFQLFRLYSVELLSH